MTVSRESTITGPTLSIAEQQHLGTLVSIREQSQRVLKAYQEPQLAEYCVFDMHLDKMSDVLDFIINQMHQDLGEQVLQSVSLIRERIPPHGRWRHFMQADGTDALQGFMDGWGRQGILEHVKILVDLFVVAVLLDAGAGTAWRFTSALDGATYVRSEGLAMATLDMFVRGCFSSDPQLQPHRVDARALMALSQAVLEEGFQVTPDNPLLGVEGRVALLRRLGKVLSTRKAKGDTIADSISRPSDLLDGLLANVSNASTGKPILSLATLWDALYYGLRDVWPVSRARFLDAQSGAIINLGDAWPCALLRHAAALKDKGKGEGQDEGEGGTTTTKGEDKGTMVGEGATSVVPFHKLTQWLCYSLLEPLQRVLHVAIDGEALLTGLPEYRNGGLLVDFGVLQLKTQHQLRGLANLRAQCHTNSRASECVNNSTMTPGLGKTPGHGTGTCVEDECVPLFAPEDEVIVQWRALTVCLLDDIAMKLRARLGVASSDDLSLAKILEAGTWKAGRRIAAIKRPISKTPPINIISDGTVF